MVVVACVVNFFTISGFASNSFASDPIRISGSSTVAPYSQVIAEFFSEIYSNYRTPIIESIGTGGGMKEFCKAEGANTLDVVNASRPMTEKEFKDCQKNGVTKIKEVMFGYDGIVLATNRKDVAWHFTPSDIYKALAAKVLINGKLVANPYKTWNEVNPKFPNWQITVYIPGEKHGTREVFEQKLLEVGCKELGVAEYLKKNRQDNLIKSTCTAVRKDGRSIDIDGDYSETLARLNANKHGVGVFGLFYYENNADRLRVASVNGIIPTVENIAKGIYPVSRPLYFYVKANHLDSVVGLKEYVNLFLLDQSIGDEGSLVLDYGLVPAPRSEREKQRKDFNSDSFFRIKE
ncbi:substrate-binding domain-containing protein [Bartonella sp. DGB1]|uniref:substrate-binding domain-containing protein n=1 Tax=Bartonella sp. DGB1 TaxID=3239807 RepID=UPI00352694AD